MLGQMTMAYSASSEHFEHPLNISEDALELKTLLLFNSEIPPIGVYDNQ
jgi:hypothetical protein